MFLVALPCPTCNCDAECVPTEVLLSVCTDDPRRSRVAFTCPTCGPQIGALHQPTFVALAALGAQERPWTLAELELEHTELIREFSDRLDSVLEAILSAA